MGKYITIGIIVALLVVGARFNLHNIYLRSVDSKKVLSTWENKNTVRMFTEYAGLPAYDRALIEYRCTPVYEEAKEYKANRQKMPHNYERGCQVLMLSGWFPGWSLQGYYRWQREK
ncbi:MAG: hypothetical protein OXC81_03270 [Betaproteobacteria bacterium]|nr:hypothetical protein [Betaproteobacteria bacterium]